MDMCIDFKTLFDAIPCKAWILSRSGKVVWQNKSSKNNVKEQDPWWMMAAESIEFDRKGSSDIRREGRWIKLTYQPISEDMVFGVESDITAEKTALPMLLKMKGELHV